MKFTEVPKKEMCKIATVVGTLWLFNIAMENDPFSSMVYLLKIVIFHGCVSHKQMVIGKCLLLEFDKP